MTQRKTTIESIVANMQFIRRVLARKGLSLNKNCGITMTQATVLFLIKQQGHMSITSISNKLGVSKSASSQLVDNLVAQNIIMRETDEEDRRILKIKFTDQGKSYLETIRTKMAENLSTIFGALDDNELTQLNSITEKLLKNTQV